MADYAIGDLITSPLNVKGLKDYPIPEPSSGVTSTTFHMLYTDIRPLYGDPIGPNDVNVDQPELRHEEGFWVLEYEYVGNQFNGNSLEYVVLQSGQPEYTYYESGRTKPYTVVGTYHYNDWDIADVKNDLIARTNAECDNKINEGYIYTGPNSKGVTVTIKIDTDLNGRQMLNNYYTQAVSGIQTINLYLSSGRLSLTSQQMISLYNNAMAQVDSFYNEADTQVANITNSDNTIIAAQTAATWLYPTGPVPRS